MIRISHNRYMNTHLTMFTICSFNRVGSTFHATEKQFSCKIIMHLHMHEWTLVDTHQNRHSKLLNHMEKRRHTHDNTPCQVIVESFWNKIISHHIMNITTIDNKAFINLVDGSLASRLIAGGINIFFVFSLNYNKL